MISTKGTISRNETGSTIDFGRALISAEYAFSEEATPWSFVPMLVPAVIIYSLAMFSFNPECSRVKKFMLTLIDGWEAGKPLP